MRNAAVSNANTNRNLSLTDNGNQQNINVDHNLSAPLVSSKSNKITNGKWGTASWDFNQANGALNIHDGTVYMNCVGNNYPYTYYTLPQSLYKYNVWPLLVNSVNFNNVRIGMAPDSHSANGGYSLFDDMLVKTVNLNGLKGLTNASELLSGASQLRTVIINKLDTSHVTDMSGMFSADPELSDIKGISDIDTSQVTNMSDMFNGDSSLTHLNLGNFNTQNVRNMSLMFYDSGLNSLKGLNNWNVQKVTNMSSMLDSTHVSDFNAHLHNWVFNSKPNISSMENSYLTLYHYPDGKYGFTPKEPQLVKAKVNYIDWFTGKNVGSSIEKLDRNDVENEIYAPDHYQLANLNDLDQSYNSYKLAGYQNSQPVYNINLVPSDASALGYGYWGTAKFMLMHKPGASQDTTTTLLVNGGVIHNDFKDATTKIVLLPGTNIYGGPNYDRENYINEPITSAHFNNVTLPSDSSNLFANLTNLKSFDSRSLNVDNVKSAEGMFANDSSLTHTDLSAFKSANNINDMSYMFANDKALNDLDLSSFQTNHVSDMSYMFANDSKLQDLNLSQFDTMGINNMGNMFIHDNNLEKLTIGNQTRLYNNVVGAPWYADPALPHYWVSASDPNKVIDLDANLNPVAGTYYSVNNDISKYPKATVTYRFGNKVLGIGYIPFKSGNSNSVTLTRHFLPDFPNPGYVLQSDAPQQFTFIKGRNYNINLDRSGSWDTAKMSLDSNGNLRIYDGNIDNERLSDGSLDSDGGSDNLSDLYYHYNSHMLYAYSEAITGIFAALAKSGMKWSNITSIRFDHVKIAPNVTSINILDTYPNGEKFWHGMPYFVYDKDGLEMYKYTNVPERLPNLHKVDLSGLNLNKLTSVSDFITGLPQLQEVNLGHLDTSKITNMSGMFKHDPSLKIIQGLSDLNTSNVESLDHMFNGDWSLSDISGLSNWNVGKVETTNSMFKNAKSLHDWSPIRDNWVFNTDYILDGYMFKGSPASQPDPEVYSYKGNKSGFLSIKPSGMLTDTVSYQLSNGDAEGQYKFNGYRGATFTLGNHPVGLSKDYQVLNPQQSIEYDGKDHTVVVTPSEVTETLLFNGRDRKYAKGIYGSKAHVNAPEGYHFVNDDNGDFILHSGVTNFAIEGNAVTGHATLHIHYIDSYNGQLNGAYKVNKRDVQVPVSGHIGDSITIATPQDYNDSKSNIIDYQGSQTNPIEFNLTPGNAPVGDNHTFTPSYNIYFIKKYDDRPMAKVAFINVDPKSVNYNAVTSFSSDNRFHKGGDIYAPSGYHFLDGSTVTKGGNNSETLKIIGNRISGHATLHSSYIYSPTGQLKDAYKTVHKDIIVPINGRVGEDIEIANPHSYEDNNTKVIDYNGSQTNPIMFDLDAGDAPSGDNTTFTPGYNMVYIRSIDDRPTQKVGFVNVDPNASNHNKLIGTVQYHKGSKLLPPAGYHLVGNRNNNGTQEVIGNKITGQASIKIEYQAMSDSHNFVSKIVHVPVSGRVGETSEIAAPMKYYNKDLNSNGRYYRIIDHDSSNNMCQTNPIMFNFTSGDAPTGDVTNFDPHYFVCFAYTKPIINSRIN